MNVKYWSMMFARNQQFLFVPSFIEAYYYITKTRTTDLFCQFTLHFFEHLRFINKLLRQCEVFYFLPVSKEMKKVVFNFIKSFKFSNHFRNKKFCTAVLSYFFCLIYNLIEQLVVCRFVRIFYNKILDLIQAEIAIAKRHPLLGHQMVLPDCEKLPPIGKSYCYLKIFREKYYYSQLYICIYFIALIFFFTYLFKITESLDQLCWLQLKQAASDQTSLCYKKH